MTTSLDSLVEVEVQKAVEAAGYTLVSEYNHHQNRTSFTAMRGLEPVGERVSFHASGGRLYASSWRVPEFGNATYGWHNLPGLHKAETNTERVALIVAALLGEHDEGTDA